MSDWQQQIEAQIAELKASHCRCTRRKSTCRRSDERDAAETIRRLLDVAVAADALDYFNQTQRIRDALDKLRETDNE